MHLLVRLPAWRYIIFLYLSWNKSYCCSTFAIYSSCDISPNIVIWCRTKNHENWRVYYLISYLKESIFLESQAYSGIHCPILTFFYPYKLFENSVVYRGITDWCWGLFIEHSIMNTIFQNACRHTSLHAWTPFYLEIVIHIELCKTIPIQSYLSPYKSLTGRGHGEVLSSWLACLPSFLCPNNLSQKM